MWWKIVEKYQVSRMFSAPTAIRVLKKFPTAEIRKHDLSSLEVLYLAGEPLDEPTASWVSNTLDVLGHRQLLADRIRLADYGDCSRSGRQADASGKPRRADVWL